MVENVLDISEDEAALYDRQIRLWGLDAQKRLRAARLLVVGLKGLGAEVCKNVVLAGVKSLTLLDHANVTEEDGCSQFLLTGDDVGKNRAVCSLPKVQQLNPMVEVTADTESVEEKSDEYFLKFDVVCLTCSSIKTSIRVNEICRKNEIKFFSGDVNGFFGYMFEDLSEHEYAEEVQQVISKEENINGPSSSKKIRMENNESKIIKKKLSYVSLEKALHVDWCTPGNITKKKRLSDSYFIMKALHEFMRQSGRCLNLSTKENDVQELSQIAERLFKDADINSENLRKDFFQCCFGELSPVCAIVGGVLAQEIVKAVSRKDQPHKNFFFYNGLQGSGLVECIEE